MNEDFIERHPWLSLTTLAWGTFAVVLVMVVVGWRVGWWFQVQDAKRQGQIQNIQSHNIRNDYSNQQTLREQITENIGNALQVKVQMAETSGTEQAALKAQGRAIVAIVCQDADEVTGDPLPNDQAAFVKTNCTAGNVSPSSSF